MQDRITQQDVGDEIERFTRALSKTLPGSEVEVTLWPGNSSYKQANRLVVIVSRGDIRDATQVWPDGMAGQTRREAYNALRLMTSALSLVADFTD